MRFGTVTLFGRSNVGKSTFLNAVLGQDLAIVSPLPQTTRDPLLGVVHGDGYQLAFIDTPGLHQPKSELGRRMNAQAVDAMRSAEVVVFMTDVAHLAKVNPATAPVARGDEEALAQITDAPRVVLALNKTDTLRDKSRLLPLMEKYARLRTFAALVPISVKRGEGTDRLLDEVAKLLPEGPAGYPDDALTDRPTRYFVAEFVRERIMHSVRQELPHAVAVSIDTFNERETDTVIHATIHVEKTGQKAILLGKGGSKIKEIGIAARERISDLLGRPAHLKLFVRVTPRWTNMPRQLAELGYAPSEKKD